MANKAALSAEGDRIFQALMAKAQDYENAVTLIGAIESNFIHCFGAKDPKYGYFMRAFSRRPRIDGKRPDFWAKFINGYSLLGEHKKRFVAEDVLQIEKYVLCDMTSDPAYVTHDVIVFVPPTNIGETRRLLQDWRTTRLPATAPSGHKAAVAVSYYRAVEAANHDSYFVIWEPYEENEQFSSTNSCDPGLEGNLNELITKVSHCPLRITLSGTNLAAHEPFINDDPPPLYTAEMVIMPTLASLLTDSQRDEFARGASVDVMVSPDIICGCDLWNGKEVKGGWIKAGLDFLVEARIAMDKPDGKYMVTISRKITKTGDLRRELAERVARQRQPKVAGKGGQSQLTLTDQDPSFE